MFFFWGLVIFLKKLLMVENLVEDHVFSLSFWGKKTKKQDFFLKR